MVLPAVAAEPSFGKFLFLIFLHETRFQFPAMSVVVEAEQPAATLVPYELTAKIDSFLRKAVRWGFSSHYKCLTDLLREADLHLFRKMTSNSGHCIHQLLPRTKVLPSLETLTVYFPYPSVIITWTNILLFLEICLFLLIDWIFDDIVFFVFFFILILCSCYVNMPSTYLLMAFDRLLLKGLLTNLLT